MNPIIGVNIVSAVIGFVLIKGAITVWLARFWPWYRRKVEYIFLKGDNLFAQNAPYSGTVMFFKWWALIPGGFLVLPRFVVIDVLIVLAAVMLWRHLINRARAGFAQT